jgi:hypothetical protein
MCEHVQHERTQRTQAQLVPGMQNGRGRPVFGRSPKIASTEDDGGKTSDVPGHYRIASSEPYLHGASGRHMYAGEARRQCRGIIGHDDIARAHEGLKISASTVRDRPSFIDDEKPRVPRPLRRYAGGDHC